MSKTEQIELIAKEALADLLIGTGRFTKTQLARLMGVSRPNLDVLITNPNQMKLESFGILLALASTQAGSMAEIRFDRLAPSQTLTKEKDKE